MKILAIETSCDETSLAVVEVNESRVRGRVSYVTSPEFVVHKNLVASQIKVHAPYGGVVPNLAKREHQKNLPILYRKIFGASPSFAQGYGRAQQIANSKSKNKSLQSKTKNLKPITFSVIDLIAVTVGPGLEPALWAGIEFAKQLALQHKKPIVGANHLEGHLYSFLLPSAKKTVMPNSQFPISKKTIKNLKPTSPEQGRGETHNLKPITFPAIALIVSGGHTILLRMNDLTHWKKLGETRDDAAGEAFDKVARILGLPYPGGPVLEKIARGGNKDAIPFPRPMLSQKNYDFSFSGLKTSVLYYMRDTDANGKNRRRSIPENIRVNQRSNPRTSADIAASFQQAVIDVLVKKTMRAADEYGARSVILAGGVAANTPLRTTLDREAKHRDIAFFAPEMEYNGDNGAMIAAAASMRQRRRKKPYPLEAQGNMNM